MDKKELMAEYNRAVLFGEIYDSKPATQKGQVAVRIGRGKNAGKFFIRGGKGGASKPKATQIGSKPISEAGKPAKSKVKKTNNNEMTDEIIAKAKTMSVEDWKREAKYNIFEPTNRPDTEVTANGRLWKRKNGFWQSEGGMFGQKGGMRTTNPEFILELDYKAVKAKGKPEATQVGSKPISEAGKPKAKKELTPLERRDATKKRILAKNPPEWVKEKLENDSLMPFRNENFGDIKTDKDLKAGDIIYFQGNKGHGGSDGTITKVTPAKIFIETTYMGKPMSLDIRKENYQEAYIFGDKVHLYKPSENYTYKPRLPKAKQVKAEKASKPKAAKAPAKKVRVKKSPTESKMEGKKKEDNFRGILTKYTNVIKEKGIFSPERKEVLKNLRESIKYDEETVNSLTKLYWELKKHESSNQLAYVHSDIEDNIRRKEISNGNIPSEGFTLTHTTGGSKTYVAHVTGKSQRYGFERDFLEADEVDFTDLKDKYQYSEKTRKRYQSVGMSGGGQWKEGDVGLTYELSVPGIYEIQEGGERKYIELSGQTDVGKTFTSIKELNKTEVEDKLK